MSSLQLIGYLYLQGVGALGGRNLGLVEVFAALSSALETADSAISPSSVIAVQPDAMNNTEMTIRIDTRTI